jgi:hypothetical protein
MTQPKRPISRSSTPIEFAPLILDLEPEVKEEPKKKGGSAKLFSIIVGAVIVIGAVGYWVINNDTIESKTKKEVQAKTSTDMTISDASISPDEKKQIFTHGVKNAKLTLESVDGQDVMKVLVQHKAPEGSMWIYEWTKNNEPYGKGDNVRGFKRGDSIAVKILPFDGENYGAAKIFATEIKNTPPRIAESQSATFEGNKLTYHLKAIDADGDTLTYSLVEGPPGVTVDQKSGVITWLNVPEDQKKLDLKIKINDGHNGEIIYPATVNFTKVEKEKLTAQKQAQ